MDPQVYPISENEELFTENVEELQPYHQAVWPVHLADQVIPGRPVKEMGEQRSVKA
ncbi:MAG: hypothetical protein BWY45_03323 [Euryarchaeota archaeon ADurb.Bin294]|jgi:hypothetical protein|nr:MAG: hypothetical protein BWY45_03323 [Euryarchaeota archaeon ADurb.Bin294]